MSLKQPLDPKNDSELVIGLIGALGTDLTRVQHHLGEHLRTAGYTVREIKVSRDVIPLVAAAAVEGLSEADRIRRLMDAGDEARKGSGDNSVLALGVAAQVNRGREKDPTLGTSLAAPKHAYIVNSLKHPAEVHRLRQLYPGGFYLLGIHCAREERARYLVEDRQIPPEDADELMGRDEDAHVEWGQRTGAAFHLSDFFVHLTPHDGHLKHSVWRIVDLLFGHPYLTPTFDEYAMYMAFGAALRSADLSRQVGAVIAKDNELLSTGANDCPCSGGGLYWPEPDETSGELVDAENGRDWTRGTDSNKVEQTRIMDGIAGALAREGMDEATCRDVLAQSAIRHLTEYGRVVHAEMEALLSCARNGISTRGATLYCTTFPCHNCAKHIIAAGITRVVYIEPYPKSKAREFHADSMEMGFSADADKVHFEPFVGVGPRRFLDLFSMELGDGYPLRRKDDTGATLQWALHTSSMRIPMATVSYLDLESLAAEEFTRAVDCVDGHDEGVDPQHAQPAPRRNSRKKRGQ